MPLPRRLVLTLARLLPPGDAPPAMGPVVTPSGPEGAGERTRPRGGPRRSLRPLPLGSARPPLGQW
eukprot:11323214-Alexandrium_andersonii.AAC.1